MEMKPRRYHLFHVGCPDFQSEAEQTFGQFLFRKYTVVHIYVNTHKTSKEGNQIAEALQAMSSHNF